MNYGRYFPVQEYYRRYIQPMNPRHYVEKSNKMVCPVHDDHDPSLGIIVHKNGEEVCHCFGCNFWGNVVELHQRVNRRLFNKFLTTEDARKELCDMFGVDYDKLPAEDNKPKDKGLREELAIYDSIENFDLGDFKYKITEGKQKKKGVAYYNTLLMIMTNEVKSEKD